MHDKHSLSRLRIIALLVGMSLLGTLAADGAPTLSWAGTASVKAGSAPSNTGTPPLGVVGSFTPPGSPAPALTYTAPAPTGLVTLGVTATQVNATTIRIELDSTPVLSSSVTATGTLPSTVEQEIKVRLEGQYSIAGVPPTQKVLAILSGAGDLGGSSGLVDTTFLSDSVRSYADIAYEDLAGPAGSAHLSDSMSRSRSEVDAGPPVVVTTALTGDTKLKANGLHSFRIETLVQTHATGQAGEEWATATFRSLSFEITLGAVIPEPASLALWIAGSTLIIRRRRSC